MIHSVPMYKFQTMEKWHSLFFVMVRILHNYLYIYLAAETFGIKKATATNNLSDFLVFRRYCNYKRFTPHSPQISLREKKSHIKQQRISKGFGNTWKTLQVRKALTLRYAIVSNGRRVNGTRYSNAGWAALNISDETVAVNKPVLYGKYIFLVYIIYKYRIYYTMYQSKLNHSDF